MTQEQAAPTQVQIPGDAKIVLELSAAKVEQLVMVLKSQSFESVASFLPEILVQSNAQVMGLIANANLQKETTQ